VSAPGVGVGVACAAGLGASSSSLPDEARITTATTAITTAIARNVRRCARDTGVQSRCCAAETT
jgi:hypothetical protein